MPWYEVIALLAAGMAAGTINAIVGAGSLITFPTLLFFGFAPLVANVSNTVGLVAGGITRSIRVPGQHQLLVRVVRRLHIGGADHRKPDDAILARLLELRRRLHAHHEREVRDLEPALRE